MSHTITVRLTTELVTWLEETSQRTGVSQGRIIREQLEKARQAQASEQRFTKLIGCIEGPSDLSQRKGYSQS
jgi:hypothetical protein